MFEMALLDPSKETENKLRWSIYVEDDNTDFELYIPKWRVPEPWPGRISVSIDRYNKNSIEYSQSETPGNLEEPIAIVLEPVSECTHTCRYAPIGNKKEWQTGEPYIPFSLIPPNTKLILLRVTWDLQSKGKFVDVLE